MHDDAASTLLIGFDSAWTKGKRGAIVAVLRHRDGSWQELGEPQPALFVEATNRIEEWRSEYSPARTLILIDQPTIVTNPHGQRPVESIVSSAIGLRFGGVQPANTSRSEMFGSTAPIWPFLKAHGNITDPWHTESDTYVLETYPVLALIAFGWLLHDEHAQARVCGRLPKYNPERRKTFKWTDWQFVCTRVADELRLHGLAQLASFTDHLHSKEPPRKPDQDQLDALICLLVGVHLVSDKGCLVIGSPESGLMLVPESNTLGGELSARCTKIQYDHTTWLRPVRQ